MDIRRTVLTIVATIMVVAAVVALFGSPASPDSQLRPADLFLSAPLPVPVVHVDPITVSPNCTNVFDWSFFKATLTQNNLGGVGPNLDDKPEIRYSGVNSGTGPFHDGVVDLVITVADNSTYTPKRSTHNGLAGQFGQINIAPESRATFHFQFVEGGTDTPITMGADDTVIFSYYDLDNGKKGHEFIEFITPTYSHSLAPETTVKCTGSGANGTLYAESDREGNGADNPSDPLHMTALQLNSEISVTYKGKSGWTVMMGNSVPWGGRNTLFGGRSENNCACIGVSKWHVEDNLKYNNLGGMGPVFTDPAELRYESVLVTPWTNRVLDLVVTVAEGSTYMPMSTTYNGLWPTINPGHQQMGQINVKCGTQTTFDFTFVETGTNTPYYLSNAFLSIYDLDERNIKVDNYEYVKFPHPVTEWALTTPTEVLQSGANNGTLMFRSTQPGFVDDNPTDPEELTGLQMAKSVTIWQASTSSFQATFGHWYNAYSAKANTTWWGGRNFLFAGPGVFCPKY